MRTCVLVVLGLVLLGLAGPVAPLGADGHKPATTIDPTATIARPDERPGDDFGGPVGAVGEVGAVASGYNFAQSSGAYSEISGGTQVTTSCDDTSYNNIPIGFTFNFDGTNYTQFSIQCNGFLAMGATVASSYSPISGGSTNNIVSALGQDLQTNLSNSEIRYEVQGSAPNQVLVVQWKNFRAYNATGDLFNVQIRLYETTAKVELIYGPFTKNATSRTVQVGLRGPSSADFNNRANGPAGTEWSASVAGATNAATMTLSQTVLPPNGQTYAWTPLPIPNVTYSANAVVDDYCGANGGPGEHNLLIDPGETVDLNVTLQNNGFGPATGVSAVLTTAAPGVTVNTGTASFPDLPAYGGTGTSVIPFQFLVDDAFPCGGVIQFQLFISAAGGGPWTRTFTVTVLNHATVYYSESFGAAGPALPAGWSAIGSGTANWTVNASANAGGTANELRLNWSPQFVGISTALTPVIDTTGMTSVPLSFKHFLDYYAAGTFIRVVTTSDGGTTFNEVWSTSPTANIGPTTMTLSIITPDVGSATFQIGFQFEGDSYSLDYWYIDDIVSRDLFCDPCYGLFLNPEVSFGRGCPGAPKTFTLQLVNHTGGPGPFPLAYDTFQASISGPASVDAASGATVPFSVELTPDDCLAFEDHGAGMVEASAGPLLDDAFVYQLIGDESGWLLRTPMPTARYDQAVVSDGNNNLYAIGGDIGGFTPTTLNERFDTITELWTPMAPMPGALRIVDGGRLGNTIVIPGGYDATSTIVPTTYVYDISGDSWVVGPAAPRAVIGYGADTCGAYLFRVGGCVAPCAAASGNTGAEYFDGTTWTPLPPMTTGRMWPMVGCLWNTYLIAAGGLNAAGAATASVEFLDTSNIPGGWAITGALPDTWWGGADFELNGEPHFVGGIRNGVATDTGLVMDAFFQLYDALPPLASGARYRLDGDVAGLIGHAVGGRDAAGIQTADTQGLATCNDCADLVINKSDGTNVVTPGDTVTYTIVVGNASGVQVDQALVEDTFPPELTGVTWTCDDSGGGGTCANPTGAGNITETVTLFPGGAIFFSATATVDPTASSVVNTATVTLQSTDPFFPAHDNNLTNNSSTDTDMVLAQSDLAITKDDGVTTAVPGQDTLTYTIVVSNAGPDNEGGATVTDIFPAILTCSWTCVGSGAATCAAGPVSGNINDIAAVPVGDLATYTAVCTIAADASGILTNTATVTPSHSDGAPLNNVATDVDELINVMDLWITKTDGIDLVMPGATVTYDIQVGNLGPHNATGVAVNDFFPASLNGVGWTCDPTGGGTCPASGSGNINVLVDLPTGTSVLFHATGDLDPAALGTLVNTASIDPSSFGSRGIVDPDFTNNVATDIDIIQPPVDVYVFNKTGECYYLGGDTVTYTIVVGNYGPGSVSDVQVTDTFPATLTGVAWTCTGSNGGTCPTSGSGNIAQVVGLPANGFVTFTVTGTLDPAATVAVVNTVEAVSPVVADVNLENNEATHVDSIIGAVADYIFCDSVESGNTSAWTNTLP